MEHSNRLSTGGLLVVAGGIVAFAASFPHFYSSNSGAISAWGKGGRPLLALPGLIGLLLALHVLVVTFADVRLPERAGSFTWTQVHVALAVWASLMMLCFLIGNGGVSIAGFSTNASPAVGLWLMLIGAGVLLTGTVLRSREPSAAA